MNHLATTVQAGDLTVDLVRHRVSMPGVSAELSAREFALLLTFLQNAGTVLSRAELLRHVWDIDFEIGSNLVEVYVHALRRKLGPGSVETVRGRGYRFRVPEAGSNGGA